MLDAKTRQIIKDTVPVLQEKGTEITKRFYQLMFKRHPELLNIFNHANQRHGKQQRALADAVYAAAANIDQLDQILPAIKRIGHKHRALGIRPDQYPIVGEHLLMAIEDTLGEAATEEIIAAWQKAYEVIAQVFIDVEQKMYEDAAKQPGGWEGFRKFVVVKKVKESEVITSFYLQPEDGEAIASFLPGQYLTLKCRIPGEQYTHLRHYSLSDSPGKDYYRISVKREDGCGDKPEGIVSTYLHRHVQEGDLLEVSAPAGDFVLDLDSRLPVVLISGGVGLTPMISMLNSLVDSSVDRDVYFIHAAINGNHHALNEHVAATAKQNDNVHYFVCYEKPTAEDRRQKRYDKEGFIDSDWLQSILPTQKAQVYLCGPLPFMKAVYDALKTCAVDQESIRYELFGPADTLEREPASHRGDFRTTPHHIV